MLKKIIICPIFLFFIISLSSAETVYLKDGKTVEGKIIEKTDKYIKVEVSGVPVTFFNDQLQEDKEKSIGAKIDISNKDNADWYVNNEFMFRMKKVSEWILKEGGSDKGGIRQFSIGFIKDSKVDNFRTMLFVNISKWQKPSNYTKREDFISLTDEVINSATKNLRNLHFIEEPKLTSNNNLKAREAIFEWKDEEYNNEMFTSILIFYEPIEVDSSLIGIQVFFKCKSKDYQQFYSEIDPSLRSIEIVK